MPVPPVDVMRCRPGSAFRRVIRMPLRDGAVQRWTNRVRCWWLRRHARPARRDRHGPRRAWCSWCPLSARRRSRDQTSLHGTVRSCPCSPCDRKTLSRGDRRRGRARTRANTALVMPTCQARCGVESCEGLVADGRRSPPSRDAGASLRPCGVWFRESFARDPFYGLSTRSSETRDDVLRARARRSASRELRRRLDRVHPHNVCGIGMSSSARPGHRGEPA